MVEILLVSTDEVAMIRVRPALPKDLFLALRVLRDQGASGEIRIEADPLVTTVVVVDGLPVHASGWETFGRWLLRTNWLALRDYVKLTNELGPENTPPSDTAFGEEVVRRGLLTLEQVRQAFTEFVTEQLVFGIAFAGDTWTFTPRKRADLKLPSGPVHVERLLLRAAAALSRERIGSAVDFETNPYPRLCEPAARIVHALSLSTPEARFLGSIDGTRTSLELVSAPLADGTDPAPLLATLILAGFVETRPYPTPVAHSVPPPSGRVSRRPRSVSPPAPRSSMRARRRSVPPELSQITIQPARVPTFVDVESEATSSLGKVRRRLDRCDFDSALAELSRMASLEAYNAECATYQAWAEYRSKGNLAVTSSRLSLKRRARAALDQNASFGFGYYVLAHIAKLEGDALEAERLLERASTLEHDREADDGSYRILRRFTTDATVPPASVVRPPRRITASTEPPPGGTAESARAHAQGQSAAKLE